MTPKVCLVSPEYPPSRWGGLARTALRVSEHLAALGLDVHVVHYAAADGLPPLLDENRRAERRDGVTVHELVLGRETHPNGRTLWDCPHALTLLMLHESLEALRRAEGFDAYLSFFLYPSAYVAGLTARRAGRPHLACVVGNDLRKYLFSPEKSAACRWGLENADRLIFLARELLELAEAAVPVRARSRILYNSVLPNPAPRPERRPGRPFTVGAAGIFKHAKGLPYLLKAVALLRQTGEVRLELAGEARPEEAPVRDALIERLGLGDVVRLGGVVPHQDMPAWLAGLDAFALPSLSEGCPNVLMEAMAAGLPCVASRVGAVPELLENGVSGLAVEPGDSRALAGALARLRDEPEWAASLGRAAALGMAAFSPERERREWEAVLREVLRW